MFIDDGDEKGVMQSSKSQSHVILGQNWGLVLINMTDLCIYLGLTSIKSRRNNHFFVLKLDPNGGQKLQAFIVKIRTHLERSKHNGWF